MMSLPQRVTLEEVLLWLQQTACICLEKVRFLFSEPLAFLLFNIKHQETRCFFVCVQMNNKEYFLPWHVGMGCRHLYELCPRQQRPKKKNPMTKTSPGSQYILN